MSEVVPFKLHSLRSHVYQDRYELFKSLLRQHMQESEVCAVIAAIHDSDCYARAAEPIKQLVDRYYNL